MVAGSRPVVVPKVPSILPWVIRWGQVFDFRLFDGVRLLDGVLDGVRSSIFDWGLRMGALWMGSGALWMGPDPIIRPVGDLPRFPESNPDYRIPKT